MAKDRGSTETDGRPAGVPGSAVRSGTDRDARRAEALKANIARRKAQARARASSASSSPGTPDGVPPETPDKTG